KQKARREAGQMIENIGGLGRNRTGVRGFAVRCMTTLPPGRRHRRRLAAGAGKLNALRRVGEAYRAAAFPGKAKPRWSPGFRVCNLERETRLELATPTLARSCSTN